MNRATPVLICLTNRSSGVLTSTKKTVPYTRLFGESHTNCVPTCNGDVSAEKQRCRLRETRIRMCYRRQLVPVLSHMQPERGQTQAQISTKGTDASQLVPFFAMQEWKLGLPNISLCSRLAKHSGVGKNLQAGLH